MKTIKIISTILLISSQIFSQTENINTIVSQIDNNHFRVNHTGRLWNLEFHSKPGLQLINIGKHATTELIQTLDDSTKAIIAHYILCKIWLDTLSYSNEWNRYETDTIIDYSFNNLKFYWKRKYHIEKSVMQENKVYWESFMKQKKYF